MIGRSDLADLPLAERRARHDELDAAIGAWSVLIDASSVGQSPPGRSVRPTEPANSTSPERSTPSTAYAR